MKELLARLRLNAVPDVRTDLFSRLIGLFGTAGAVLDLQPKELSQESG
ncbi:MAG: hypothetical protein HY400_06205, partial [Elusimicrobia bacterium]|nr:hypothetical protein [Elusimicrobiota bacterium]